MLPPESDTVPPAYIVYIHIAQPITADFPNVADFTPSRHPPGWKELSGLLVRTVIFKKSFFRVRDTGVMLPGCAEEGFLSGSFGLICCLSSRFAALCFRLSRRGITRWERKAFGVLRGRRGLGPPGLIDRRYLIKATV